MNKNFKCITCDGLGSVVLAHHDSILSHKALCKVCGGKGHLTQSELTFFFVPFCEVCEEDKDENGDCYCTLSVSDVASDGTRVGANYEQ